MNRDKRLKIQGYLELGYSVKKVSQLLKCNPSTIYRELQKHVQIISGVKLKCNFKTQFFVCNLCPKKAYCGQEIKLYNFEEADDHSKDVSRLRMHTRISKNNLIIIDQIVYEGVVINGQSLHHIYVGSKLIQSICSERTIRRMICRGELKTKAHMLRRYVVYKHEYQKPREEYYKKDVRAYVDRTYSDYLDYVEHNKSKNIVQFDSVIGKINDKKAILTITFKKYGFQFGILIDKSNPKSVDSALRKLKSKIGDKLFYKIFAINIADNGFEFTTFYNIEYNCEGLIKCRSFFTRPYNSSDKAECESAHRLVRYFCPKGVSLNNITQDKIDDMYSNIDSYIRRSQHDKCPYDLIKNKFGKDFLDLINIKKIPNKKVKLTTII
jgi:transposase, IS30 family